VLGITIPSWSSFAQYVFSGLSVGCLYALVALGFVIIANVTGVYNFAQGDYVMVGGMVVAACSRAGWSMLLAVPLAVVVVAAVALAQERLTVAPIRRAGALPLVVASLGVGVVLEGIALLVWGKDPFTVPSFNEGIFQLFGAYLSNQVIWVWCTTFVLLVGVVWLFRGTALGRAMRACAINPVASRLLGIRVASLSMVAFVLAGALSGLVGAVTVPLTGVTWNSGLSVGLVAFIAAALGNFTSPIRTVIAGLSLGVIEALAAGMISSGYREAIVYGVLIVYLFCKDLVGDDGVLRRLARRLAMGGAGRLPRRERTAGLAPPAPPAQEPEPARSRRLRPTLAGALPFVGLALLAISPVFLNGTPAALDTMIFVTLLGMGATGLGLIMGLAGQFSLGQGAMYLISGYTAAILVAKHGWNPIAALVVAVLAAAVAAYAIGLLTIRLRGFNLAIATLAIQLILLVVVVEATGLTGGPLGTTGLPPLEVFGLSLSEPVRFFYVGLAFLVLCVVVARNLTRSRIGRALRAVGSEEDGARSLGVNASRNKLVIFVLGGMMGGLGGVLWAYYLQYAAPSSWDVLLTINLITYVIVGGTASVYGPVVGTLILAWVQYWISGSSSPSLAGGSSEYIVIISGALLVLFVLFFREGVVEGLKPQHLRARAAAARGALDRLRRRRAVRAEPLVTPDGSSTPAP
jgi:branched-subunit amino acid ABC-type transport system permease component